MKLVPTALALAATALSLFGSAQAQVLQPSDMLFMCGDACFQDHGVYIDQLIAGFIARHQFLGTVLMPSVVAYLVGPQRASSKET